MKRGPFLFLLVVAFILPATLPTNAHADAVTIWNFNSTTSDGSTSTGTNVPSLGYGTAVLVGGVQAGYATGSTNDPAAQSDDSGWNTDSYPAQGMANKTAGAQYNVSTLGYSNIVVRFDLRVSSTAGHYYRFQYSTDGVNFFDHGPPIATVIASASSASYYEAQTNSLADVPGANNNANFAFRIVSEFESTAVGGTTGYVTTYGTNTYSTGGTVRFDFVVISGTPIPGANTPPTITSISNQTVRVNQSTGPLAFTIADAQDSANSLTLNKISSDTTVIPLSSIVFGGSGSSRSVTVNAGNQLGSSIITLWVIDTGGRSNSTSFTSTVLPLNTAPVISSLPPTNTLANTPTPPLDLIVYDLETPSGSLTLSGNSANPGLVPNGNFTFDGSGSNRTVTITPAPGLSGVAPITVNVSDGTNAGHSVFPLMVLPSAETVLCDPFTYADGSLLTNSAFLWDNTSGTVGEIQTTSGQLQIISTNTEDVVADLVGGPYVRSNSTVLYASFKMTALALPKNTPDYFAHFVGSANRGRVYVGITNAGSGFFRLFIGNGTSTNPPVMLGNDLEVNTPYTVVTRYDIDSATATLWLNPNAESDPSITGTDPQSAITISSYGFRQSSGVGANILVDDLRVGLSFNSVLSSGTGVTPIPVTAHRYGSQCVLTWSDPAFSLQSAPAAAGPYTTIGGATSPYTNTITGSAKFFRLKSN